MDFKLYTTALKAYTADNGDMYVSGTTSSTIRDLHGDEMTMDALKSMAETAKKNMTIWLNHNYNVPEDLFGSVTDARIVKRKDETTGQEVYDLDIDIKVCPEDENPEAIRTYKAIKRGVRLGLSIGARVEQASKKKDKSTGEETFVIERIALLESSVVGIPANQRSYLQSALKSLRSRSKEIAEVTDAVKAVEVEGQPAPDKTFLISALTDYLANNVAFYLKAHGAHWNVVGEDFSQYHELFQEIYEDAQGAIDPIAELIRKLNGVAPATLAEIASQASASVAADDNDPESLAEALYTSNEALLDKIAAAISVAGAANQQGILNFLAERQDMHQKWSWQLRASLAPEEAEPEPAETPEMPGDVPEMEDSFKADGKWVVGAARDLPIAETSRAWDGAAAKARIFAQAGFDGDSPKPEVAKRAFLVYDAANPELKGSYKLPFADIVDGEMKVIPSGLRAAASRLPGTGIPADVRDNARAVIDAYEKRMQSGKSVDVSVTKSEKENVHMDNTENLTAEAVEEVLPPEPPVEEPAEAPVEEPVVEAAVESVEEEKALTVEDRCKSVMGELEAMASEEADATKKQYLTHAHGWCKAYMEYAAAPDEENPSTPGEQPGEPEADESKPAAKSDEADLAKVALDAADAVRAEVEALKSELTALVAEKAKVESDFEKAVALLEKAAAVPVGRKSGYHPSSKAASKAVWLEPYVQRLLDANEE